MLKLTIQDVENDRIQTRFGSDDDLLDFLKRLHPVQLRDVLTLSDAVNVLNATDLYAVRTGQYEPDPAANLLPEDYRTHSQADTEDPWPRAGHREV